MKSGGVVDAVSVDRVCQVLTPMVAECVVRFPGVRVEALRAGMAGDGQLMAAAVSAGAAEVVLDQLGAQLAGAVLSGDEAVAGQVGAARARAAGILAASREQIRARLAVLARGAL